jgi:hypothetical protein
MIETITVLEASAVSCNLTMDNYEGVLFEFPQEPMRIVRCRENLQWVVQRREKNSRSKWSWRSLAYCVSRDGLTRALRGRYKATLGLRAFVDSLPEHIHQSN